MYPRLTSPGKKQMCFLSMCFPKVIWSRVSLMWRVSMMSHSRARGWFLRADSRRGIWLWSRNICWNASRTHSLFCLTPKCSIIYSFAPLTRYSKNWKNLWIFYLDSLESDQHLALQSLKSWVQSGSTELIESPGDESDGRDLLETHVVEDLDDDLGW